MKLVPFVQRDIMAEHRGSKTELYWDIKTQNKNAGGGTGDSFVMGLIPGLQTLI